jgi:hypothetical protein
MRYSAEWSIRYGIVSSRQLIVWFIFFVLYANATVQSAPGFRHRTGLSHVPKAEEISIVANAPPHMEAYSSLRQRRLAAAGEIADMLTRGKYLSALANNMQNLSWGDWTEGVLITVSNRTFFGSWEKM